MGARRQITSPAQSETRPPRRERQGAAHNGKTPPPSLHCRAKPECSRCCRRIPCRPRCRRQTTLPRRAATPLGSRASATGSGSGLSCAASPAPTMLPNSPDQPSCSTSRRSRAPVLLLTTPRKMPLGDERAQQLIAARQRAQPVEMDRAEAIEIDAPRLFPSVAEMTREALAQTEPDAFLGLAQRPQRLLHRRHHDVERFVDRRPAVDQRVVPVEQDRPRPGEILRRCRRDVDGAHAAAAT